MKINKFFFKVRKRVRKLGLKKIDANEDDVHMIAKAICDINENIHDTERTLVFDVCTPSGTEVLFFDEKRTRKRLGNMPRR